MASPQAKRRRRQRQRARKAQGQPAQRQRAPARKAAPPRRRRAARARQGNGARMQMSRISPQLIGLVDPWRGKNAKWPDSNATVSNTLTTITRITITPNGDGIAAFRFYPGVLVRVADVAPTITASTTNVTNWGAATACANYTNINAGYASYRVVSAGFKLRYVGNDYNNGGVIGLRESVEDTYSATSVPLLLADFCPIMEQGIYKKGCQYTAHRTGIEAEHYTAPSSTQTDAWPMVSVWIYGADGTTPQSSELEIVQNLELLAAAGTMQAQMASKAANYDLRMIEAVSHIHNSGSPFQTSG